MGDLSKHFNRAEFACKDGCGRDTIDHETLLVLEDLRKHFDAPVRISSGYRCPARNKAVGGSPGSQHLYGRAADVTVDGAKPSEVADYLDHKYPGRYGIGRYATFTHLDTRTGSGARW